MSTLGSSNTMHSRNGVGTAAPFQGPHLLGRPNSSRAASGAEKLLAEVCAARANRCSFADFFRFAVVAAYLTGVMAWLLATRRLRPNFSVRRGLHTLFARRRNVSKEV